MKTETHHGTEYVENTQHRQNRSRSTGKPSEIDQNNAVTPSRLSFYNTLDGGSREVVCLSPDKHDSKSSLRPKFNIVILACRGHMDTVTLPLGDAVTS
ncbi:hypothetical protein E2C01_045051 [Portunus trituberculatus]|uniref:Uncharacterized protein n=1 Tax=Portunus trituberculatus TaxID=210409 RepID=A0A5B7G117_PORTR|nr:hypothetical protein [Portunus trituberculatus]